jgi:hypothetical protein
VFSVINQDQRSILIQQIARFAGEKDINIEELLPIWEAIVLGGLLKTVRNRIRFKALNNFIVQI